MENNSNKNNNQKWVDVPSFVNSGNKVSQQKPRTNISQRTTQNDAYQRAPQSNKRFGNYEDSRSFVKDVNSSLAKQVQEDMDRNQSDFSYKDRSRKKKKKNHRFLKAVLYTLLSLTVLGCLLFFTPPGQKLVIKIATEYIYGNLDYKGTKEANGNSVKHPAKPTDKIINILLIGVEEFDNARNTDSMIIATMNTETHSLKLTSLMRDMYLDIPGHGKNRLNAAYSIGKIDLLTQTIEQNLGVTINGYCLVNFDAFERIVNIVNGVDITLTEQEAHYLNTTNYISNKKYRNVVAGKQTLNGNQALGYCRIRKRPTATESNDFGRTQRHRIVLNAIFDKVKSKNVIEMAFLMNKIIGTTKIDTNITKGELNRYLEEAVNLKVKHLDTYRVPTDDNFENIKVTIGNRPNREVLTAKDWDKLRADLKTYIYGGEDVTKK